MEKPVIPLFGSTRTLSREEAIEQYVILRMRSEELNRLDYLLKALKDKSLAVPNGSPFTSEDLADTVRTTFFGWLSTLTDKDDRVVYPFNCLLILFPEEKRARIIRCQLSLEACHPKLQQFRNNVAFHARSEIEAHIKARMGLRDPDFYLDVLFAIHDFQRLMEEVESEELQAIPELPNVLKAMGVSHLSAFARPRDKGQSTVESENSTEASPGALNWCQLLPDDPA